MMTRSKIPFLGRCCATARTIISKGKVDSAALARFGLRGGVRRVLASSCRSSDISVYQTFCHGQCPQRFGSSRCVATAAGARSISLSISLAGAQSLDARVPHQSSSVFDISLILQMLSQQPATKLLACSAASRSSSTLAPNPLSHRDERMASELVVEL